MRRFSLLPALLTSLLAAVLPAAAQKPLEEQAAEGLARAAGYFRKEVGVRGAYLWTYSEDLKTRRGEEPATATQGWLQPPGTPAVGAAYLRAYQATGDAQYLDAAREAAHALADAQLVSGGWDELIEMDAEKAKAWHRRQDLDAGDRQTGKRRNVTTFDDDKTQSALRLLMRVDTALERKDAKVRRAVEYGLAKLLEAQYPNGAWPQRWDGKPRDPARYPVQKARYPEQWSRTWPRVDYKDHYTFNDNTIRDILLVLLEAHHTAGTKEYLDAAKRGGDFLILAQLPEPQPAWAQQYNLQMEPAWARKFEPPAVTGGESAGVIRTLLDLYVYTGDEKYLKPVPPALEWFRRSRLPDGRWARFYELKTNRPLYFTMKYDLVYTDDDLPTHYAFKVGGNVAALTAAYERLTREGRDKVRAEGFPFERRSRSPEERRRAAERLAPRVREILAALDARGRWVEDGSLNCRTFNRNVETLAEYLASVRGRDL